MSVPDPIDPVTLGRELRHAIAWSAAHLAVVEEDVPKAAEEPNGTYLYALLIAINESAQGAWTLLGSYAALIQRGGSSSAVVGHSSWGSVRGIWSTFREEIDEWVASLEENDDDESDEEKFSRLADEAEAGYDPAKIQKVDPRTPEERDLDERAERGEHGHA